ncbi:pentatricopeptide repeat-containing protein At1g31920 [Mangifera indica]|uniref:pentatricopeptide repeat-containing protein At1g31920 n=1 Tax=Mangifera indica TaxID=29780 RepID=UPI001CFC0946|nr:pentatricopeptide repeat-containing protein At1g31920 [Mangifera indica]
MSGTSILHHHLLLFTPPEDQPKTKIKTPEADLRLKEQECLCLLKRCNNLKDFKQVHVQVLKWGLFSNPYCASNLLAACALSNWGSMDYACSIFNQIDEPGAFVFNTLIRGFVKDDKFKEAWLLYIEMLESEVQPDNFTYPALLKACAVLQTLEEGMQIHGHANKLGFQSDLFVQNALINMYGKCKEIELSYAIFEQMDEKSVASWSATIAANASVGLWYECLMLFGDMMNEGCWRPEESTLVSVISACAHMGCLDLGRCTHGSLIRNISELNVTVQTSLMDMYVKCGRLEKGLCLFQMMAEKNQSSYSVMISGLAMHGQGEQALRVFSEMLEDGVEPDDVIYVSVLSACSHAGLVDEGLQCFDRMRLEHGITPTVQHYGCLVDLLGRAGMLQKALELIKSMAVEPNDVVWRSLLSACKVHQNLEIGEIAANSLFQLNSENPGDYIILSNMYAQAQRWDDAAKTRMEMTSKGLKQTPGFSLVVVSRKVHRFVSEDKTHHKCHNSILEMIHQMEWQLRFEGYSPDTSQVLVDVDEQEKRERLKGHSQKLAIAFALINTSQGSPIRITRNIRMCSDCHTYTKFISAIYEREILVRDRKRFHHFKDGTCSCQDYW